MQNDPIIEFIVTLPKRIENYIISLIKLYFELIWVYPFSLINIFFIIELIIGWNLFFLDKFRTKPYKMENNWWLEYKQNLFYIVFVIELFLYSNCFWQFYNINLSYTLVWFFLFNWFFGFFSKSMKERWLIRINFLCFYSVKINKFFFIVLQLNFVIIMFMLYIGLKANSCLFLSFFFFLFRLIDFFIYSWLKKSWPLFKETDEGEFFEFFDSYSIEEKSVKIELERNRSLIFKNLLYYNNNHLLCTPYSKPIVDTKDIPLFDYWGVENGIIRWREKYFDEHRQSYDLYIKRTTTNLWIEPLHIFDPFWKKLNKKNQSSKHCLTLSSVDLGFLLKRLGPKLYYDPKRVWNIKKIAPTYNELVGDSLWTENFLFSWEYSELELEIYLSLIRRYYFYMKYMLTIGYWTNQKYLFDLISVPYAQTLFDQYHISNFEVVQDSIELYDSLSNLESRQVYTSVKFTDSSDEEDEEKPVNKRISVKNGPIKKILPLKYYLENHLQNALYGESIRKDLTQVQKERDQKDVIRIIINDSLVFKNISSSSLSSFRLNSAVSSFFEEHCLRIDGLDIIGFLGVVLSYDMSVLRFRNFFFYMRAVWFIGRWDRLFFRSNIYFFNQRDFFILFFYNSEKKLNNN